MPGPHPEPYYIDIIDEEFYTSWWIVHSDNLIENPVNFFAECFRGPTDSPYRYIVSLFFSVGDHSTRVRIGGKCFGTEDMTKDAIDTEIHGLVSEMLSNNINALIENYLYREEAW